MKMKPAVIKIKNPKAAGAKATGTANYGQTRSALVNKGKQGAAMKAANASKAKPVKPVKPVRTTGRKG